MYLHTDFSIFAIFIQLILIIGIPLYNLTQAKKAPKFASVYDRNRNYFQNTVKYYAIAMIISLAINIFFSTGIFDLLLVAIFVTLGLWWLSLLFHQATKITDHPAMRFFYYIGIILTIFFGITINQNMGYMYYGPDRFFSGIMTLAIMILIGTAMSVVFSLFLSLITGNLSQAHFTQTKHQPKVKQNIREHYYEQGLSDQDIDYFREQMAPAKEQIEHINEIFGQTAKLRAIEVRHNTNKVLQSFFKDIVEEPQRIAQASTFLYKYLPSLEDLILKYNEINSHVAKNKQTYIILDRSAQIIDELCQQISEEYVLFHQDTYNDLDDEIKYVEKNLRHSHTSTYEESDDLVDDLIKDNGYHSNEDLIDDFFNETESTTPNNKEEY
ncbi:5-bromo-4-chloroindolyl phosphate hydrolysis family protein [Fundicoccus culcitae]|uniref:5-bromo-4-chloroindolyl phosphate hydrolysis family protein n=1 Tax=Fundicoccus culcitae TaxID=2969821 RepID=A0ABY5P5J0_9LACT|nr:5-bromo-4-chloroindolyl phosphate hydrolysis family protein [Fundicoccus culcitae]UUX34016.1 5-bromo-4-chloroindolyl phosphate hydrolysis family protein [Fundicoccus culcitae]